MGIIRDGGELLARIRVKPNDCHDDEAKKNRGGKSSSHGHAQREIENQTHQSIIDFTLRTSAIMAVTAIAAASLFRESVQVGCRRVDQRRFAFEHLRDVSNLCIRLLPASLF